MSMYQKPEEYVREFIEGILSSEELKGVPRKSEATTETVRLFVDYRFGDILIEAKAPGKIALGRGQLENYMRAYGSKLGLLIDIPVERYYIEYPGPYTGEVCYELYMRPGQNKGSIYQVYRRCFKRTEIDIARKELTALLKVISELNIASLEPKPQNVLDEVKSFVNEWEGMLLNIVRGAPKRVEAYRSIWRRNMELLYGREVLENIGNNLDKLFVKLTIYMAIVKALGATILESVMGGGRFTIPLKLVQGGSEAAVELFWKRKALTRFNINFLFDRDEYDWIFSPEVAGGLDGFFRDLGKRIAKFNWGQPIELDLLKRVYQHIVDPELRRQLGEFYTPDWLAKLIVWRALHILVRRKPPECTLIGNIDEEIVGLIDEFYRENGRLPRFIDPTCGSFTFGVQYLNALLDWYSSKTPKIHPLEFARDILNSVVGIDLNPVAVTTAKVNYLLQIHRLLMIKGEYLQEEPMIPIYRVDLVAVHEMNRVSHSRVRKLDFYIMPEKDAMSLYIPLSSMGVGENMLEVLRREGLNIEKVHVKKDGENIDEYYVKLTMPGTLINKIKSNRILAHRALVALAFSGVEGFENEMRKAKFELDACERGALEEMVKIARILEKHGLNSIWYSILANHLLVYIESMDGFDLVVGNLPWVNVSKYPESYRNKLREIAKELGVNPPKEAAKKLDISVILFAISTKYLLKRDKGVVGLMVPTSIFRGLHGAGWRLFLSSETRIHEVFDLEAVKPFEDAENQPGVVFVSRW